MNKKKIVLIFLIFVLVFGFIASFVVAVSNSNIKISLPNENKISIYDPFGVKQADYVLLENSQFCTTDCYSKISVNSLKDSNLIDGLTFKGKDGKTQLISDYNISVIDDKGNIQKAKDFSKWNFKGGIYTLLIQGTKSPLSSVDWVMSSLGLNFTEWTWWNSWQDWNDDFETANLINQTLWYNQTASCEYGGFGCTVGSSIVQDSIFGDGNAHLNTNTGTYCGAGTVTSAYNELLTRQDYNDSLDYTINFTMNSTFALGDSKLVVTNALSPLSWAAQCAELTTPAYLLVYNFAQGTKQNYSLKINASNKSIAFYNSSGSLLNTTNLSSQSHWYVGYFFGMIYQPNPGGTTTQDEYVYNFTSVSGLSIATTLLSPPDTATINNLTTSMGAEFNMSQSIYKVVNGTLSVWNSSNVLIYTNSTTFSGTNQGEILNISYTFPAYGTYHFNFLGYGTDGTKYVKNSASANRTFTLNDTISPSLSIISPGATVSSANITLNFSATDTSGISYLYYNITRGASTEKLNTNLSDSGGGYYNDTYTLSGTGNYILNVWTNDTNGNTNQTSFAFSYSTISPGGGGGSGGGGGAYIPPSASQTQTVNICNPLFPKFQQSFNEWTSDVSNFTRIKQVWFSYWDYATCYSAGDLIPLNIEVPVNSTA